MSVARQAAEAAERVAMRYFGGDIAVDLKADESPVTVADREAEQAIRQVIREHFPDHALFGEEFGRDGDGDCLWLIDPIDGTRSFIRKLPFWSTQIALMIDGELVLGVSSAPPFNETAWAVRGGGAFINGQPVRTRAVDRLEQADVCFGNLRSLSRGAGWSWVGEIVSRAARSRGYGDFYSYHRLADGGQDVVIESDVNILDIAAVAVIVREAGGIFTDLAGDEPGLETTSVLAACPQLHGQLLSSRHE
ncbi:inositol-phosphate phosphatase [Wenzhouxiangella sp. XN201]|uniref:inositol monophosphatase family protein n=1 Tax=Wenzhouxiangella sp. XN201 TaxID=2710755 RepID=UPI0013C94D48|nr:inositol monophosphatase family protein [Wenzhouxiangella sp. XN201]NEZ03022.1 inositol-phosphate phosphatase [Wenzhouxiangella sp. XN201]